MIGDQAFPFLSLPHPELLCSSLTTQNEWSTRFSKCSWHCCEWRHILCSRHSKWDSYISAQQADGVDFWQIHINNGNGTTSDGVIPLMPNPSNWVMGRTEVIAKLKRHFFTNTNDSAQNRKFCLLHGMGGIGKTQICLKFVEEMYDR